MPRLCPPTENPFEQSAFLHSQVKEPQDGGRPAPVNSENEGIQQAWEGKGGPFLYTNYTPSSLAMYQSHFN